MLYLIVITVGAVCIAALHAAVSLGWAQFPLALAWTALAVAVAIAIDGVLAFLVRRLPERFFRADAPLFRVGSRERRLWRKIGVQRWKDLVPELGMFTGFRKSKFDSATDAEYLARFLLESNYGVLGHLLGAAFGFAIIAVPCIGGVTVGLPVAIVNAVLSLMPCAILRYHTPPLTRLWRRSLGNRDTAE